MTEFFVKKPAESLSDHRFFKIFPGGEPPDPSLEFLDSPLLSGDCRYYCICNTNGLYHGRYTYLPVSTTLSVKIDLTECITSLYLLIHGCQSITAAFFGMLNLSFLAPKQWTSVQ